MCRGDFKVQDQSHKNTDRQCERRIWVCEAGLLGWQGARAEQGRAEQSQSGLKLVERNLVCLEPVILESIPINCVDIDLEYN